jgi:hypothetical protein
MTTASAVLRRTPLVALDQHATALRTELAADTASGVVADVVQAARALLSRLDSVAGNTTPARGPGSFRRGRPPAPPNLAQINSTFGGQLTGQDLADMAPTEAMLAGFAAACRDLRTAVTAWRDIRERGLADLNAVLTAHGMAAQTVPGQPPAVPACGRQ